MLTKVYKVEKSSQKNGFCLSRRSQRRIKRASHDKDIGFYELKITSNFQKTNMTRTRTYHLITQQKVLMVLKWWVRRSLPAESMRRKSANFGTVWAASRCNVAARTVDSCCEPAVSFSHSAICSWPTAGICTKASIVYSSLMLSSSSSLPSSLLYVSLWNLLDWIFYSPLKKYKFHIIWEVLLNDELLWRCSRISTHGE